MNLAWGHAGGADVDVVDPVLGPLRPRFDPRQVQAMFTRAAIRVEGPIAVENVCYDPARSLVVVYRCAASTDPNHLIVVRYDDRAAGAVAPGALAIPGGMAWRWPSDPGNLPLANWQDPAWNSIHMTRCGLACGALTRPRVLSYLPGKRCALLWHDSGMEPRVVLKAFAGAAASHSEMARLWRDPARRVSMPEPLAVDAVAGVRWERFMPGLRVEQAAQRTGWPRALRAVLEGLVHLHGTPMPNLPVQSSADVIGRLQGKVLRRIASALPRLAPACTEMTLELARTRPRSGPVATLHGDLHTGNVLVGPDGRAVLIDLDGLTQGHPAYDLALFASRLLLVGLRDPAATPGLQAAVNDLPRAYVRAGGNPDALADYSWYLAVLLIARQIKTCIRHGAPGLERLALQILVLAQRAIGRDASFEGAQSSRD
jgi:aminoglycoside phosphotransferase